MIPSETTADQAQQRSRQARLNLMLVTLAVCAALGLGRFGFSMLLPAMQVSLGLSTGQAGQLQSWNFLGYLLAVLVAGVLATRYGPRRVICSALALSAVSMLGNGLLPGFYAACGARFLGGIGGAATNVPAIALLAAWFSGRRRGLATGCAVGGSSLGLALTGVAVPPVLAHFAPHGWRFCWLGYAAITLVICLLCALFLRDHPPGSKHASSGSIPAPDSCIDWGGLLGSSVLWRVAAAYFAFGFSYSVFATFFPKHLADGVGLGTAAAGTAWMQIGLVSIVSGFIWGGLSDHWGRRLTLILIFLLQGGAFLAVGLGMGSVGAWISGSLFALTAWSIPAVVAALCGDTFGARLAPASLGLATVVFGCGQVLGPLVGGMLADASGSLAASFSLAGGVSWVLGAGMALTLPRAGQRN